MGEILSVFWEVFEFLLPIFVILMIPVISRYVAIYAQFQNSNYRLASGNTYFQTIFNVGNYGEFLTYRMLEKVPGHKKIITNLYLPKEDGKTTEVDLIMIHESGVFVFESKNYSGWIFGDEESKMWTQTLKNGMKNRFYNPIWQNKAHISALKKILPGLDENHIHSYIIFSERCELKKVNVTSPHVKLIKRNRLLTILNSHIQSIAVRMSVERIEDIYNKLVVYSHADKEKKLAHISSITK